MLDSFSYLSIRIFLPDIKFVNKLPGSILQIPLVVCIYRLQLYQMMLSIKRILYLEALSHAQELDGREHSECHFQQRD